jgi:hypothetical protein
MHDTIERAQHTARRALVDGPPSPPKLDCRADASGLCWPHTALQRQQLGPEVSQAAEAAGKVQQCDGGGERRLTLATRSEQHRHEFGVAQLWAST